MTATASVTEPTLRVLHLTDPHLFAAPDGELRGVVTRDSLQRVLRHYRGSGFRADLVIATGDIGQDDSAAAYDRFRHALITLDLPVLCVPGNHDVHVLMRESLADPPFEYCAIATYGNWLFAGIDSCIPGHTGGRVADSDFERLHAAIEDSPAEHALVYLHHPPVELGSAWLDRVGLENGPECLREFARTGHVRAVLFGHAHQAYDNTHNGIHVLGTPSTCRQFRPSSAVYATDDQPPAYRLLELSDDGVLDTRLVWVDEN